MNRSVHEPPIQIRYRSVGSHEALGRLTRDGLKEWTLLEHPQWDEDLCVQLAEALPDNPWAATSKWPSHLMNRVGPR